MVETGLALLAQAKMPIHHWWDAFFTVVYLINQMSSPTIDNSSPYTLLKQQQPDYKFLRVFGLACYPCLRPYQHHKFEFHIEKCVFLGYADHFKGYKCMNAVDRVYISRHVCLNEAEFNSPI